MKKITLFFFLSLFSFCGYSQVGLPKEGFETGWTLASTGATATGWFTMQNEVSTGITWIQGQANNTLQQPAYEGERAAFLARQNVLGTPFPEDYLVTPEFEVPQNPELHFYSRLTLAEDQGSIYKIFIINLTETPTADLNSPAAYTEIQSWTELEINPAQTTYYQKIVPIPDAYIGAKVRIAFMMVGDDMDRWLVDNVEVIKKCELPVTLEATNVNMHSADLIWGNPSGAEKWDIELISELDVPTGVSTFTYTGTLPFHVANLDEDSCYKFYVRAVCQDGGKSDWQGAAYFCTEQLGDACTNPLPVATLPFTSTDNTTNFADHYEGTAGTNCNTGEEGDYLSGNDVVYKYTATFTGEINIDLANTYANAGIFIYGSCDDIGINCLGGANSGGSGVNVSIDGFTVTNGEDYYIVISTAFLPTTPYTLTIQAVACDEPVGLPVTEIGMTSAKLSWTNPTGASLWELVVQNSGIGVPQGSGETITDNTDYLKDDLLASTAYEYWVRADCNNGTFSAWAGPYYFNTMICEAVDQCVFKFNMWGKWGTWEGHTMAVKQNGITITTLTGPNGESAEDILEVEIPVCNNYPLQLFWNPGGDFPWSAGSIGVSIKNSFGQEIFVKEPGQGIQNSTLYETIVDCEKPYCLAPKDLTATNATQTTVDLSWDGPATGEWEYYIVEEGAPAPDDTTEGILTTTNPTLGAGELVASKNYKYYVRERCENANTELSTWSKASKFSSSVCASEDKCDYTFILTSDYYPTGGWEGAYMTIKQNGTNVAILGPSFTEGMTKTITVPLCHDIPFKIFWNSSGNSWIGGIGLKVINAFNQIIFEFPIGTEEGINTNIYEGEVDCESPACIVPTGLTALNGTMTSIDLKWDGPTTGSWKYYIVETGGDAPTESTTGTTTFTNPVTAPLANPATNYEYYVKIICTDPNDPGSTWAGPYAIHSEVCEESEKCTYFFELKSKLGNAYSDNTMTVYQSGVPVAVLGPNFNEESDNLYSQMVEVKLCSDKEIKIIWDKLGHSENDKGLHVYNPYMEDVYVKPFGEGSQGETLFTGLVSCEAPPCPKPQNLSVSDVGLDVATLDWDEMGDATSWEVMVLPLGSPAPTTAGEETTVHPFPWNHPLLSSTPYVFYVRANCGETDGYSTWTGPFPFVTKIGNDECNTPAHVPVNSGVECLEFVSGTLTGSTGSGVTPSCAWAEPEFDVWYEFTAVGETHVVSLFDQLYFDAEFAVYEGDDCGDLVELACGFGRGVVKDLVPGNKYLIQVYANYLASSMITSFNLCVSVPRPIIVDDTLTPEDIVKNSLITSSCANIENITWRTGTDIGINGIAYFEKGPTTFPLEEGIVLTTGYASKVPGPHLNDKGDGGWAGDDQLFEYMDGLGLDPGSYNDATVLEFDFTPLGNKIKFPFVFASEEYGHFQCTYSDAFAFFLTTDDGTGTPVTTNLAVVPETNSPVSVVTIRDTAFNPECESVNEAYFDKYYGESSNHPELVTNYLLAPVNFEGNTIKMYAEADVIPNQIYHIKLVIADRGDINYDSAVFIGKFDIGDVNLGPDLTIENGTAICLGTPYTIESGIDADDYSFTWSKDGEVIEGETVPNLVVTETGVYTVVADLGGTCSTTDSIKVEFYPEMNTGNPVQLIVCDADGFATFNLSDNTAIIVGNNSNEYTVSYHLTEVKALANEEALPLTNYENVIQFEQLIYVRIVNTKGCVAIKSFSLVVQDLTPIFKVNNDFSICKGTTGTITAIAVEPANYDPATVTYSWTLNDVLLPNTTSSITVNIAGVYKVTINNMGCIATATTTVTVKPIPVPDTPADVVVCISYKLPALSLNNNYYTGSGGTGKMLSEGDVITSTQTIYVYAESATAPKCTAESSFVITIIPTAIIATTQGCEGNEYILEVLFDGDKTYNPDNTTIEWMNSTNVVVGNKAKLSVTERGIYTVTVTPIGGIGCPVSNDVIVDATTCMIPRGISPNKDGKNDEFDLSSLKVKKLAIFNRYGKEVYKKDNYKDEFNGQGTHGDDLPTGTYFYMIEREGGESITGWIYINRNE